MSRNVLSRILGVVLFASVLGLTGCANQQAIDSYVDAVMLEEMNSDQDAIASLEKSVQANPRFALAWSLMGQIHQKMNEFEKSAAAYEKATDLNRWSYKDFFNLGKVYQTLTKYSNAVRAYVRATEIDPASAPAHLGAAQSYYQLKDYKNALKYGKKAGKLDPNDAQIQSVLGDVYGANKDFDGAVASYKRALEIDANNPQATSSLAVAYLRTGKVEAAHELLSNLVAQNPTSAAYQQLGYANLKLKRTDDAVAAYRNAVELGPEDWSAYKGLGVAMIMSATEKNDPALKAEAISQWKKSLELHPDQPKLQELLEKYSQ